MLLGFIGLGLMGESMALNLVKKSNEQVIVFDLVKDKIDALVQEGAIAAASDIEVVEKADIVFTSVPKSEHVESIFTNVEKAIKQGQLFIEMSTISPTVSIKLSNFVAEKGAQMLDTPLVKSKKDAIAGTLGIYVGGNKKVFEQVRPYLECIGSEILYMGASGSGITMKICHNMLLGEIQNGVNEMLVLASQFGIDIPTFKKAVSMGGAKNAYIETKADIIEKEEFQAAFSVSNMNKDVNIANELLSELDLYLPGVSTVLEVYQAAMSEGLSEQDLASTITIVKQRASTS